MKISLITIQEMIEEVRQNFGRKADKFLQQKFSTFAVFASSIISAKSFAVVGCGLVVMISMIIASMRDIGHDSALYIEIARKLLSGGKYYYDFYEINLPLSFLFTTIPVYIADLFGLSPIIFLEIFADLVGICTLYFSAKILARSDLVKDRAVFNLIILGFAVGFFLRVFTLCFNEFGTKSTYFLAFAFPYISYILVAADRLKKSDEIWRGILAGLLFCLKPNYGILAIVFEAWSFLNKFAQAEESKLKRAFLSLFCLRNYVTCLVILAYFLLLFLHFPDFLNFMLLFCENYFSWRALNIFMIFKEDLMPLSLFVILSAALLQKREVLQKLYVALFAVMLIVMSEFIGGYDQRFVIYSVFMPILFLSLLFVFTEGLIKLRRDWLMLLMIILIPQFDESIFTKMVLNLYIFWWVIAIILMLKWRGILAKNFTTRLPGVLNILRCFFIPKNLLWWLVFAALVVVTMYLAVIKEAVAVIFSALIFVLLSVFYSKIYAKFVTQKYFSPLSAALIFIVLSYVLHLHLSAIFRGNEFTSPNQINDKMMAIVNSNLAADENFISVAAMIPRSYPMRNYTNKINPLPNAQFPSLFLKIENKQAMTPDQSYIFSNLKQQISDPKNKLIFIENKITQPPYFCTVEFLEYYLHDAEFREIFLKNYRFLDHVMHIKSSEKNVEFFAGKEIKKKDGKSSPDYDERVIHDFEVYVRK